METLLTKQTTADNKMITPSQNLLPSQPAGGRKVSVVRSLSGGGSRSRYPRPATGDYQIPSFDRFYDHAEGDTVWDQNIVYAFYADEKTVYPLTFSLYEKQDEDDQDHETKYDLARDIVTELEEEIGGRRDTYLFDSWFAHYSNFTEYIESYNKDWIGPLRSNRKVTYNQEKMRVDALCQRIDTTERGVDHDLYYIWTNKHHVSVSGAAGSSQSSAILLTANVTRSVKPEISVDTFRILPLQRRYFADLIRRRLVIKHGPKNGQLKKQR